jgi:hypothetical protein
MSVDDLSALDIARNEWVFLHEYLALEDDLCVALGEGTSQL